MARACDAPSLPQELLEPEIRDIVTAIALPVGFAEAVDATVAAAVARASRTTSTATLKMIAERQRRLNDMYELGRIERDEYARRSSELDAQRKALAERRPEPLIVRQQTMLRTLVDRWDAITTPERRRLIELVFAEIHADRDGVTELVPRDDWRAYMKAMVPMVRSVARRPVVRVAGRVRTPTERKTGLDAPVPHREIVLTCGWMELRAAA